MYKAKIAADGKKKHIITRANEEVGQIINQENAKMQSEKAAVLKEIKKEVAELVVASIEKILEERLDAKKDAELIKKAIKK
mgnify:FL=1